jgi:hypothetical protein
MIHDIHKFLPSGFIHRTLLLVSLLAVQMAWPLTCSFGQTAEEFLQVRERFDRTYGSDCNLLNGRQYHLYYSSTSHPFLNWDQIRPGRVVLNGVAYEDVPINYDLYQQALILQYISNTGETRYIVLNREFVDEFRLDGKLFRKVSFPGEKGRYCQVIGEDKLRFLIRWNKNMNFSASVNETPYRYSDQSRHMFLAGSDYMHRVGSRSSFLECFEDPQRSLIRQYMREERIRLRHASDLQLQKLLEFCNHPEEGRR